MDSSNSATSSPAGNLSKRSPQSIVSKLIYSQWITPTIGVVARYRIPDLLAGGPQTTAQLAAATGLHTDSLGRVMRALAAIGVFKSQPDGTYALTELSEVLRSNVEGTVRAWSVLLSHPCFTTPWCFFDDAVHHGTNAFKQANGEYLFAYLSKHPCTMLMFQEAKTENSGNMLRCVVYSFSFAGVSTLMDVGGGHGALLAAILVKHPKMQGILFDKPDVITDVEPLQKNADARARCRVEGGDFFTSVPFGADAAIMSFIIHDWDDAHSTTILKNVRAALPINGKLFVCEHVIAEGEDDEPFLDLLMLMVTHSGRERSEKEYGALFSATGFELVTVHHTSSIISVIEGRACKIN